MNFSSKLLQQAVEVFAALPGIGKKSALRLVLYLIEQDQEATDRFTSVISEMRKKVKTCIQCHNISDQDICSICSDPRRDHSLICVVEGIRDVMAIEDTNQYRGLYHVLGGVISPIEGIGPDQLNIQSLLDRINQNKLKELIMAISPTIEGDTTIFYLSKQLKAAKIKISTIARGVSFGGELEYADEITLGRSIMARTPYAGWDE